MAKYYSTTLQKGSKGDEVKEWQNFLNSNGYNLSVDGDFGDKTYNATLEWQRKNGLGADGIVGKNTWSKAGYSSSPSSTDWSYGDFTYDDFKEPEDFSYGDYVESDTVKQAEDALSTHTASKPGAYQSQWQSQLDSLMSSIMGRDKFSFDLDGDTFYQQAVDKFTQRGQLAMQDTMGQAAALTGGYGNSYAQAAGQQAYQRELDNLDDIAMQSYQMALDRYNQEGQDLYNQYGLLADREDLDYGRYRDTVADYLTERDYLQGRYDSEREFDYSKYNNERGFDYDQWSSDRAFDYSQYSADRSLAYDEYSTDKALSYEEYRAKIADEQWQKQYDESVRQYNEQMALQKQQYADSKASSGGGGNGGNGSQESGATYADTLWYATGTTDDQGNPVFRNSDGKTQAYGAGINPYTGTKHKDAKYGTFSNGYQPNNINGTKLKNSGMSTSITGKSQTIWEANGKYWLWRGDLNRYEEVDISD